MVSKAGRNFGAKASAPRVALEITESSAFSNPTMPTPKGQGSLNNYADERARKKQEDAELLGDDIPNLQQYAR